MRTVTLHLAREDATGDPAASDAVALTSMIEALAVGLAAHATTPELRGIAQALYAGSPVTIDLSVSTLIGAVS
jgi:hypothetical protein